MEIHKIVLIFILLISSLTPCFADEGKNYMLDNKTIDEIEAGFRNNNLQMTIYYIPISLSTLAPVSAGEMKNGYYYYKINVNWLSLYYYKDVLRKIERTSFKLVSDRDYINNRVYCELVEDQKTILSLNIGTSPSFMMINNKFITTEKTLLDLIYPFLPENESGSFEKFFNQIL